MGQQSKGKVRLNKLFDLIQRNTFGLSIQSFIPSTFSLYNLSPCPSPFLPSLSPLQPDFESLCVVVCTCQCTHIHFGLFYTLTACVSLLSLLVSVCMCALCVRVISSECRRVMCCLQCWPSEC